MSIVNNSNQSNNYCLLDIMRFPDLFNNICNFIAKDREFKFITLDDFIGTHRYWDLLIISKEYHNFFNKSIDLWSVIYRWSPLYPGIRNMIIDSFKAVQKRNVGYVDILLPNTRMTKDTFKVEFLVFKEWRQEKLRIIQETKVRNNEECEAAIIRRREIEEQEKRRRENLQCKRCHIDNLGSISNGPECTSKDSRQESNNYIVDENGFGSRCEQIYLTQWIGAFGMYMCSYCGQYNFDENYIPKYGQVY